MPYRAPLSDYTFFMQHLTPIADLAKTALFADATDDVVTAILHEAGKMCEEVLAPLQRPGDQHPAYLDNGVVRTPPGFADGYRAIAEGGWVAIAAGAEYGGMGLPMTLTTAVNEMMAAACLSLQLNPLMTQGQIEALEHHASDEIKALYLPKLIAGTWCGTMNLTEPHAGSDVGALSSKAIPNDDGTYAISGQKIYISWADNDFTENICHLVLARLPDAGRGTKGISLFMVPKFIPDAAGNPGPRNDMRVVSLEHKMGLHGSPTAVMQYEGATGWLIGAPHDGMRAMFTMMNNARLGVGGQGIGAGEGAYQLALDYARGRKQGRSLRKESPSGTIIDHADIRRMLLSMKADLFAARAIAMACGFALDMARASDDARWHARAALLTPIAKAFGTETGMRVSELGVQIHGGMGFIEETGAAQFSRDVRVTAIYEGTNGIQAMDLVGRKMQDEGEAMFALLDEAEAFVKTLRDQDHDLAEPVWQGLETLREATEWMVAQAADPNARFAGAVPYLLGAARVLGGYYHLRAVRAEATDRPARRKLAKFYITRLLPEYHGHLSHAQQGCADLYEIDDKEFDA